MSGWGDERLMMQTRSRCANVYQDTEQFGKALAIRLENIQVMPNDIYLGYEYSNTGKIYELIEGIDSAEYYYKMGLAVFEEGLSTDPRAYRGKAVILRDLAGIFHLQNQPDSVIKYATAAADIFQELNVPYELAMSYLVLVRTLMNRESDLEQTHLYTQKVLELAESINARYVLMDLYEEYSRLFELEEDYKASLEAYKKHTAYRDSIFGPKELIGIALLQAEDEKARAANELQRQERSANWKIQDFLLLGAALLLIALLYRNYQHTQQKEL